MLKLALAHLGSLEIKLYTIQILCDPTSFSPSQSDHILLQHKQNTLLVKNPLLFLLLVALTLAMDTSSSSAPPQTNNKSPIIFDWAHTECKLTQHPVAPTRKLPDNCWELNSLLVDRTDTTIMDGQIFELFKDTCIGVSFSPQHKY